MNWHRLSKAILPIVSLALLVGCSSSVREASSNCLKIVEAAEQYPSTLEKIAESSTTKPLTGDEYAELLASSGLTHPKFTELRSLAMEAPEVNVGNMTEYPSGLGFQQASLLRAFIQPSLDMSKLGLLTTKIDYDVDNGRGVPQRKSAICEFALKDIDSTEPLIPFEVASRLEALRRQSFGFESSIPNKGFGCCIPKFSIMSSSPTNSKINLATGELIADPVAGGVVMWDEVMAEVRRATASNRNR